MPVQTMEQAADVAGIIERYRHAEAQLHRRRQSKCGPSTTDRLALQFTYERFDAGLPCTPKDITNHVGITSASTTALLDRLEGVGLATRVPSERDRRSLRVVPVDRRQDPNKLDPLSERIAALAAELPHAEAETVCDFLQRLAEVVDDECAAGDD